MLHYFLHKYVLLLSQPKGEVQKLICPFVVQIKTKGGKLNAKIFVFQYLNHFFFYYFFYYLFYVTYNRKLHQTITSLINGPGLNADYSVCCPASDNKRKTIN